MIGVAGRESDGYRGIRRFPYHLSSPLLTAFVIRGPAIGTRG
jgi:hypothetical protein